MTSYRAAYYITPDHQGEVVLTGPEQSKMSDAELIEAAVAEAYNGDMVSREGDEVRLSEEALREGLRIGEWQE